MDPKTAPKFQVAAKALMGDSQLRKNVRHATKVIQTKRAKVVAEMPDWQDLREAGKQIRQHTMRHLDFYLEEFERNCTAAGGHVHWAKDAEDARRIVVGLVKASGADGKPPTEVIKIKSMTTEEIQLNKALEAAGIHAYETDLAELIIQLGHDQPSHIVVPALHKNRAQIREIFQREMNLPELGGTPQDLADAARRFLREKFLRVKTAVSGANFLVAETGSVCIVESEGNGRMCLTLPETLISVAGIDKVVPRFQDLEVMLQLLPRSATGERMNPYNSIWTGVDKAPHGRRRAAQLPRRADGQCADGDSGRRRSAADAALHPLRGLPECVPGVSADWRPCVWECVCGADRCDSDAAVDGDAPRAEPAVRVQLVRRVLRGLPGEDQYSGGADPPAQQGGEAAVGGAEHAGQSRGDGAEGGGAGLPQRGCFPRFAETGAAGGVAAVAQGWAGRGLDRLAAGDAGRMDAGARPARDAEADVPRMV